MIYRHPGEYTITSICTVFEGLTLGWEMLSPVAARHVLDWAREKFRLLRREKSEDQLKGVLRALK